MSVIVGTAWQGLATGGKAALQPQPVRAEHVERIVEDVNRTMATRTRCLWSYGAEVATVSATLVTILDDVPIRTSPAPGATGYTVQIMGSQIEAKITVDDGSATASATATQSSASTATATATMTTAPPVADDADLWITVEIRATSGTGTLLGIALIERELTASEI